MSIYGHRGSEGKQPARVDVVQQHSAIGDMASENWPLDSKELCALGNLDNDRLRDLYDEIVGARGHYGLELEDVQREVHQHRVVRNALRGVLVAMYPRRCELDSALVRLPGYEAVHRLELRQRERARQLNGMLQQLLLAQDFVQAEMTSRIKARGFCPLPGHVHLFNLETAKHRRRKRTRLRKNRFGFAFRSTR